MSQETLAMSGKERERLVLMRQVQRGEISLTQAAGQMGVSLRQAIRIKKRFGAHGAEGLLHRARGMPSNRRAPAQVREEVVGIYCEHYGDYGPTYAAETMLEKDGIRVHPETLRRWLIGANKWEVGQKPQTHRTWRERRRRFGEMLQMDGSDHAWFEDRGERCTLMVMVDDATGRIALHMAAGETTQAALELLHKWVRTHGVPAAIYTDRNTVYFTQEYIHNHDRRDDPEVYTDFMKVTDRLGIEMIPAYSPQAKGRVERINGVLQDRLVKEMRLRGICTIEAANQMLDDYARRYSERFGREPAQAADAHRKAPRGRKEWERCFCVETTRVVQNDYTVSLDGWRWQILKQENGPAPRDRAIYRRLLNGEGYWLWKDRRLRIERRGRNRPGAEAARGPAPAPPGFSA